MTPAGIASVLPTEATYTENQGEGDKTQHIGIKNNLRVNIYAAILSSVQGTGDTRQFNVKPGTTEFWPRQGPEVVLISVGSAPGVPRAFLGKVGLTLEINDM